MNVLNTAPYTLLGMPLKHKKSLVFYIVHFSNNTATTLISKNEQ